MMALRPQLFAIACNYSISPGIEERIGSDGSGNTVRTWPCRITHATASSRGPNDFAVGVVNGSFLVITRNGSPLKRVSWPTGPSTEICAVCIDAEEQRLAVAVQDGTVYFLSLKALLQRRTPPLAIPYSNAGFPLLPAYYQAAAWDRSGVSLAPIKGPALKLMNVFHSTSSSSDSPAALTEIDCTLFVPVLNVGRAALPSGPPTAMVWWTPQAMATPMLIIGYSDGSVSVSKPPIGAAASKHEARSKLSSFHGQAFTPPPGSGAVVSLHIFRQEGRTGETTGLIVQHEHFISQLTLEKRLPNFLKQAGKKKGFDDAGSSGDLGGSESFLGSDFGGSAVLSRVHTTLSSAFSRPLTQSVAPDQGDAVRVVTVMEAANKAQSKLPTSVVRLFGSTSLSYSKDLLRTSSFDIEAPWLPAAAYFEASPASAAKEEDSPAISRRKSERAQTWEDLAPSIDAIHSGNPSGPGSSSSFNRDSGGGGGGGGSGGGSLSSYSNSHSPPPPLTPSNNSKPSVAAKVASDDGERRGSASVSPEFCDFFTLRTSYGKLKCVWKPVAGSFSVCRGSKVHTTFLLPFVRRKARFAYMENFLVVVEEGVGREATSYANETKSDSGRSSGNTSGEFREWVDVSRDNDFSPLSGRPQSLKEAEALERKRLVERRMLQYSGDDIQWVKRHRSGLLYGRERLDGPHSHPSSECTLRPVGATSRIMILSCGVLKWLWGQAEARKVTRSELDMAVLAVHTLGERACIHEVKRTRDTPMAPLFNKRAYLAASTGLTPPVPAGDAAADTTGKALGVTAVTQELRRSLGVPDAAELPNHDDVYTEAVQEALSLWEQDGIGYAEPLQVYHEKVGLLSGFGRQVCLGASRTQQGGAGEPTVLPSGSAEPGVDAVAWAALRVLEGEDTAPSSEAKMMGRSLPASADSGPAEVLRGWAAPESKDAAERSSVASGLSAQKRDTTPSVSGQRSSSSLLSAPLGWPSPAAELTMLDMAASRQGVSPRAEEADTGSPAASERLSTAQLWCNWWAARFTAMKSSILRRFPAAGGRKATSAAGLAEEKESGSGTSSGSSWMVVGGGAGAGGVPKQLEEEAETVESESTWESLSRSGQVRRKLDLGSPVMTARPLPTTKSASEEAVMSSKWWQQEGRLVLFTNDALELRKWKEANHRCMFREHVSTLPPLVVVPRDETTRPEGLPRMPPPTTPQSSPSKPSVPKYSEWIRQEVLRSIDSEDVLAASRLLRDSSVVSISTAVGQYQVFPAEQCQKPVTTVMRAIEQRMEPLKLGALALSLGVYPPLAFEALGVDVLHRSNATPQDLLRTIDYFLVAEVHPLRVIRMYTELQHFELAILYATILLQPLTSLSPPWRQKKYNSANSSSTTAGWPRLAVGDALLRLHLLHMGRPAGATGATPSICAQCHVEASAALVDLLTYSTGSGMALWWKQPEYLQRVPSMSSGRGIGFQSSHRWHQRRPQVSTVAEALNFHSFLKMLNVYSEGPAITLLLSLGRPLEAMVVAVNHALVENTLTQVTARGITMLRRQPEALRVLCNSDHVAQALSVADGGFYRALPPEDQLLLLLCCPPAFLMRPAQLWLLLDRVSTPWICFAGKVLREVLGVLVEGQLPPWLAGKSEEGGKSAAQRARRRSSRVYTLQLDSFNKPVLDHWLAEPLWNAWKAVVEGAPRQAKFQMKPWDWLEEALRSATGEAAVFDVNGAAGAAHKAWRPLLLRAQHRDDASAGLGAGGDFIVTAAAHSYALCVLHVIHRWNAVTGHGVCGFEPTSDEAAAAIGSGPLRLLPSSGPSQVDAWAMSTFNHLSPWLDAAEMLPRCVSLEVHSAALGLCLATKDAESSFWYELQRLGARLQAAAQFSRQSRDIAEVATASARACAQHVLGTLSLAFQSGACDPPAVEKEQVQDDEDIRVRRCRLPSPLPLLLGMVCHWWHSHSYPVPSFLTWFEDAGTGDAPLRLHALAHLLFYPKAIAAGTSKGGTMNLPFAAEIDGFHDAAKALALPSALAAQCLGVCLKEQQRQQNGPSDRTGAVLRVLHHILGEANASEYVKSKAGPRPSLLTPEKPGPATVAVRIGFVCNHTMPLTELRDTAVPELKRFFDDVKDQPLPTTMSLLLGQYTSIIVEGEEAEEQSRRERPTHDEGTTEETKGSEVQSPPAVLKSPGAASQPTPSDIPLPGLPCPSCAQRVIAKFIGHGEAVAPDAEEV